MRTVAGSTGGNDKGFSAHSCQQQPDHPLRFPVAQPKPRQTDLPAGALYSGKEIIGHLLFDI